MQRLKCFIHNILPPFIEKTLKNVFFKSKIKRSTLIQVKHTFEKCVIIGNGPSLNLTMEKYLKELEEFDKIVVNEFALTDFYSLLKPGIYALADPAYFDESSRYKETARQLFKSIDEKTKWPLTLVIPDYVNKTDFSNKFINPNIVITQYIDFNQSIKNVSLFELWDNNLTSPPCQTVLNLCLYLALFWKYPEIYIVGADSSFLEDIFVDQITNDLYTRNTHFYDNKKVIKDTEVTSEDKGTKWESDWTLSKLLYAFGKMFEGYEQLKEYADYKGLKVYNASEYSWINCFERKKLR
ncbi:MAG: hypothetical protein MJZ71_03360 [Bacteroidales bacterium]|nr:hypothetical protein [Bacteroidales bacterium]